MGIFDASVPRSYTHHRAHRLSGNVSATAICFNSRAAAQFYWDLSFMRNFKTQTRAKRAFFQIENHFWISSLNDAAQMNAKHNIQLEREYNFFYCGFYFWNCHTFFSVADAHRFCLDILWFISSTSTKNKFSSSDFVFSSEYFWNVCVKV